MNPGLIWLLRRAPVTFLRSVRRRFRGPKGAMLAIGLGIAMLPVLLPSIVDTFVYERDPELTAMHARAYGPLMMLGLAGMTLLVPAQRLGGLYFRPAEVGMLFPAPLRRRELLAYHLLSRAQIQVLSALWVSVIVMRYAGTWYGCLIGVTLALVFLQMLSQAVALVTAAAGKRVAWPLRWALLLVLLGALVLGVADAASSVDPQGGYQAAVDIVLQHPAVELATRLFVPFAYTFAATSLGDVAVWAGLSVAVMLALVVVIARLDVAYEEAALDVSRNVRRKLERMRSGGGAFAVLGPSKTRIAVPRLPFLGGAGPLAWRQLVEITRNSRAVLIALLMLLLWPAIMGVTLFVANPEGADSAERMAFVLAFMLLFFSYVSTQSIGFDFRRDLDRIAFLRSLPVRPLAVAAGQVGPAALLLAALQTIALGAVIAVGDLLPLYVVPALLPVLLPLAWSAIALDNVLFLLFPHRIDPDDAGNVGFVGRMMLVMMLKMAGLGVLVALGGVLGGVLYWLLEPVVDSVPAGVISVLAGMTVVVVADVVLTWFVSRAYAAFDPGRDTPA